MVGMEMASNGYLVFMLDHLDGTCIYTELQSGERKLFDSDIANPHVIYDHILNDFHKKAKQEMTTSIEEGKQKWHGRIETRASEISELITEFVEPGFIGKLLNAPNQVSIDADKIIVSGHSMGGATALKAGDAESRIKIVLAHDPWMSILEPDYAILDGLLRKPLTIITSGWLRDKFDTDNDISVKLSPKIKDHSQF